MAAALKVNASLESLDLSLNNIGDAGVRAFVDMISTNRSVKTLLFKFVPVTEVTRKRIDEVTSVSERLQASRATLQQLQADLAAAAVQQQGLLRLQRHCARARDGVAAAGQDPGQRTAALGYAQWAQRRLATLGGPAVQEPLAEADALRASLVMQLPRADAGAAAGRSTPGALLRHLTADQLREAELQGLHSADRCLGYLEARLSAVAASGSVANDASAVLEAEDEGVARVLAGLKTAIAKELGGCGLPAAVQAFVDAARVQGNRAAALAKSKEAYALLKGLSVEDDVVGLPHGVEEVGALEIALEAASAVLRAPDSDAAAVGDAVAKALKAYCPAVKATTATADSIAALARATLQWQDAAEAFEEKVAADLERLRRDCARQEKEAAAALEEELSVGRRPDLTLAVDPGAGDPDCGKDPWLLFEEYMERHHLRLVDLFLRFDKDGSGKISREEFCQGVAQVGGTLRATGIRPGQSM
jgi:hypothetical protein